MSFRKKKDHQTVSLFTILVVLTILAVMILKLVLFGPQSFFDMAFR